MKSKAKGIGAGDCCCGGCYAPPSDGGAASTADVISYQHFCCRCIPKYVCVTLTGSSGYDNSGVMLPRICGSSETLGNSPQFIGQIFWDQQVVQITVSLEVRGESCFLVWEIPDKDASGEKAFDHSKLADTAYDCAAGMKTEDCVKFGGEWEAGDKILRITPSETLDIKSIIDCGGCKCICKCMCISIASRPLNGDFTLYATNEVVCAEIVSGSEYNCDESLEERRHSAVWSFEEWSASIDGNFDGPFTEKNVVLGTVNAPLCDLNDVFRFSDLQEDVVHASEDGQIRVIYSIHTETEPVSFRWIGRSINEDSVAVFEVWNQSTLSWDHFGSVDGRAAGVTVNRFFSGKLDSRYVDADDLVKVRITSDNADSLFTDLLRLTWKKCCKIVLNVPDSVPYSGRLEIDLSNPANCPSPYQFFNFTDDNDTEWYVTLGCSWCNGECGTVSTPCCPKPIPRTLFAEVMIDCPTCTEPFVVPLFDVGGGVWQGEGVHCNQPFDVTFACSGSSFVVAASGTGACSYVGSLVDRQCDPLYVEFSGRFQGGIGCCGVGSTTTDTSITIVIFE